MNLGILVLLGITFGVLAAFARFFLVLSRRARAASSAQPTPSVSMTATSQPQSLNPTVQ
jgi:hypothetical protein